MERDVGRVRILAAPPHEALACERVGSPDVMGGPSAVPVRDRGHCAGGAGPGCSCGPGTTSGSGARTGCGEHRSPAPPGRCALGLTSGTGYGFVRGDVCELSYTTEDAWQTLTVPDGVTYLNIWASGAYGGGFCGAPYDGGGAPGGVNGTLPVTGGEVVKFFLGEVGSDASDASSSSSGCVAGTGRGGYGGGGNSGGYGHGAGTGGGGGGATVVVANGTVQMVAGGGGGTGEGGEVGGYLQPGLAEQPRPGAGGAGAGGTDRPDGAYEGRVLHGYPGRLRRPGLRRGL